MDQRIRELAYAKWKLAGCPDGDGVHFWLEAESELEDAPPKKIAQKKSGSGSSGNPKPTRIRK